eukprot:gb/GECG01014670.1/.p1 GENE.gb/GECG01014670.1/~~gb/GECG01014670.1/.p1  ORF type:complete len:479 (+),score=73.97 gb/GECG01014670.1/:1-1437(+)
MSTRARSMLDDINASLPDTTGSMYPGKSGAGAQAPATSTSTRRHQPYSWEENRPSESSSLGFNELWYQNRSPTRPQSAGLGEQPAAGISHGAGPSGFQPYAAPTSSYDYPPQQMSQQGRLPAPFHGDESPATMTNSPSRIQSSSFKGYGQSDFGAGFQQPPPQQSTDQSRRHVPVSDRGTSTRRHSASFEQQQLMDPHQSTNQIASSALDNLTGELDTLRQHWREDGTKVRQKMINFHRGKVQAEERLAEVQTTLERKEREWEHEKASYQKEIDRLKSTVRHLVHENDHAREERYTETGSVQSKLSSALKRVAALENELADERARRINADGATEQYTNNLEAAEKKNEDLENQLRQMEEKTERERKSLLDQMHQAQQRHKREVQSLQEEVVELTNSLKNTQSEASERRNNYEQTIYQLRTEVQDLQNQLESKNNELERLKTEYTKASTRAETLERSLQNTDSEFAAVAEAVQNMCYSG